MHAGQSSSFYSFLEEEKQLTTFWHESDSSKLNITEKKEAGANV